MTQERGNDVVVTVTCSANSNSAFRVISKYNVDSYVGINFVTHTSKPSAIATKKFLHLADYLRTKDSFMKVGHVYVCAWSACSKKFATCVNIKGGK